MSGVTSWRTASGKDLQTCSYHRMPHGTNKHANVPTSPWFFSKRLLSQRTPPSQPVGPGWSNDQSLGLTPSAASSTGLQEKSLEKSYRFSVSGFWSFTPRNESRQLLTWVELDHKDSKDMFLRTKIRTFFNSQQLFKLNWVLKLLLHQSRSNKRVTPFSSSTELGSLPLNSTRLPQESKSAGTWANLVWWKNYHYIPEHK